LAGRSVFDSGVQLDDPAFLPPAAENEWKPVLRIVKNADHGFAAPFQIHSDPLLIN
jgi:hypothetical protein